MRLVIKTSLLSKAGGIGLIAVKKQVTKKGKTFSQTFYVKPDTLPKEPNGPTSVAVLEPSAGAKPKVEFIDDDGNLKTFESNRPEGGFYVNMRYKNEVAAVRVPQKYILKVFEHRGHTFVVHRRPKPVELQEWDEDFSTTELTSGLRAGSGDTPKEAKENALATMTEAKLPQYRLDEVIHNAGKVEDIWAVITGAEDWSAKEPKKYLEEDEIKDLAKELWKEHLEGEDGGFLQTQVIMWLKDVEKVKTSIDAEVLKNDVGDQWALESAIMEEITYDQAVVRAEAIGEIQTLAMHSDMWGGKEIDFDTISDWARENEDNLTDGFDAYGYGVNYESGDEAWAVNDIVAYAIINNVPLSQAQETAEMAVHEEEAEMEAERERDIEITSDGKDWDGSDIHTLGNWVGGTVRTTRDACKELDDCRRRSTVEECPPDNEIVRVVEEHLAKYVGDTLYRGTGNSHHAWLDSKPGDIVPYGMSSFSRSESKAKNFDPTVMLIIERTEEVVGVDVYQLIQDGKNQGFGDALGNTNVDAYEDEQEYIIRAPALEILRREEHVVYVKPIEMSLLQIMKALFEDRIKNMERTFDYPLHREPEDAWK